MRRWLSQDGRAQRLVLALGVYAIASVVYFALAPRNILTQHTPYNHFAVLAECWLDGRLDLGGPPPPYAQNNDFASFGGKWFVTFPPFPAVLMLPLVAWAGKATEVQDGQFMLWLAGIGPAALFLVLEKLRRMELMVHGRLVSLLFSGIFAFGSVYFFTALQGTVWFAAHVVAVGLTCFYALFALDAERPLLAGLMLGLAFATRSPLIFAFPLFLGEVLRRHCSAQTQGNWLARLELKKVLFKLVVFGLPVLVVVFLMLWHNHARFGDGFEFGYRHLTVGWQGRMQKWGLFNYHFLGRNLAVVLTGLPFIPNPPTDVPFQINHHGLALWITTPLYLWLLWPKRWSGTQLSLGLTTLLVAVPTLLYQNTGWMQFGYRFSNDYAPFLICLLALGGYRLGKLFWTAVLWSVVANTFGAATFQRGKFAKYYYSDPSQRVLHQPD